jgi:hypothetical protein
MVPYIKVKETNDKLIYYDKKNDKFVWEFKINLSHLPQDIEEDIGKMITSHQFRNNVLKIQPSFLGRFSPSIISAKKKVKSKCCARNFWACNYPQKNGKLCDCMSKRWSENVPDKYRGGQLKAFRTMLRSRFDSRAASYNVNDMLDVSLCGKHMNVKDFSWDKYFEANGYKLRNGVMCKVI